MNKPATRVMSGATGFIGSHFALRWLLAGQTAHVLVRAPSEAAALARVENAVEQARASTHAAGPRLDYGGCFRGVCCDLLQPRIALSPNALREKGQHDVTDFWHFAASLRYEDRHRAQIYGTNVEGTRRALELARELKSKWFIYISTAYTAGRMTGLVPEKLHGMSVGFNNYYEESKAQSEHEVASFCAAHEIRHAILRPSIVIGPYSSKSTGGTTTGLYGFAREIQRISLALRERGQRLELNGDPETECNLIPVDWFVDDVISLVGEGLQDRGVYHHTCESGLTIRAVGEVLARVLGTPGFSIQPEPPASRSPLEALLARRIGFYAGYLSRSKSFARRRPFSRRLTTEDLQKFVEAFVKEEAAGEEEPSRASA
jgi:nucleoside-diphosphate-sugar epimerase